MGMKLSDKCKWPGSCCQGDKVGFCERFWGGCYQLSIEERKELSQQPPKPVIVPTEKLAELVLIYFTKEELHPDEANETQEELVQLAREIEQGIPSEDSP